MRTIQHNGKTYDVDTGKEVSKFNIVSTIGSFTYHNDNTNSNQIGSFSYHSDGTSSNIIGNFIYTDGKSVYIG